MFLQFTSIEIDGYNEHKHDFKTINYFENNITKIIEFPIFINVTCPIRLKKAKTAFACGRVSAAS
jgi:hypothetical protein